MLFGTVVDTLDPLKLGRVKVKVYSIHDNIDTKDLGWSQVIMPANTPAIRGIGHSVNLLAGTLVSLESLDSKLQEFLVTGTLPTKTDTTTDDTDINGEAVTISTPDNDARVRGEANPHIDEPLGTYEPASSYDSVYPYNNVYTTESGHVKEYDDTPGAERIKERHKSGTQYEISANGSKVQRVVSDNYQLVCGHDTVEVHGNVRIIVSGHCDLAVAKDLNAQVGGNMSANVTGNTDLLVKGDIDGEVRGNIDINVGPSNPEHVIYNDDGVAVHHVTLGGYTRNKAIDVWFPPQKTDTFTLTHRNMRKVKEMSATAQEPYATALATFSSYDPDKVKLVDGSWTYPDKTSLLASFGNIDLHTEGGLTALIGGEVDMTVFQNAKLDIRKDANILIGGNSTSTVTGNMTASIQGTTSLIGIDEDGEKLLSIDFDNVANKITLDSTDVEIKGKLKVFGTTTTSEDLILDTHIHGQPNTGIDATVQGDTLVPENS